MRNARWICLLVLCLAVPSPARAETPYEKDQREQLEKARRQQGLSPQVLQAQRWEREWKEQHPGQPVPNQGVLQKLHRQETMANINAGFAKMRADRQAELRREHQLSRRNQEQKNAAQHITWTPQQWQAWERLYEQEHKKKAEDYGKARQQAAEFAQRQREQEEEQKRWKQR